MHHSTHVPKEGLEMWLSAKFGVESEGDRMSMWSNPKFGQKYKLKTASHDLSPLLVENNGNPGLEFSYLNYGNIVHQ
jgi:hypothetical protein